MQGSGEIFRFPTEDPGFRIKEGSVVVFLQTPREHIWKREPLQRRHHSRCGQSSGKESSQRGSQVPRGEVANVRGVLP